MPSKDPQSALKDILENIARMNGFSPAISREGERRPDKDRRSVSRFTTAFNEPII